MNLLVLDTETTGLPDDDPPGQVVEVAAALYNTTCRSILCSYSGVLPGVEPSLSELDRVRDVHDIDADLLVAANRALKGYPREPPDSPDGMGHQSPLRLLRRIMETHQVDAIAAHNETFDRGMLVRAAGPWWETAYPWVCTRAQIAYPKQRSASLAHLAVDHGLGVTPQSHRAIDDVLLLCRLLDRVPDLDEQVRRALLPRAEWSAEVSYDDRQLAKDARFRWDGDRKLWVRELPRAREAHPELPFRVRHVQDLDRPWEAHSG